MATLSPAQQKKIVKTAKTYVKATLIADTTGHDWLHIQRVLANAKKIAAQEKANPFLVELMTILHEAADRKIVGAGMEEQALVKLQQWLMQQQLPPHDVDHILYVIAHQSYAASGIHQQKMPTIEGQIVQDADRLEALGAIGIARCFAYNGKRGNPIYNPKLKPRKKINALQYKKNETTAINHFYEKLLKLSTLMNTRAGKKIAGNRHRFMEKYLQQFFAEWNGRR